MKLIKSSCLIAVILLGINVSNAYAAIDKSMKGTLKLNGKLTLGTDFFIPHIPYDIICTIKNTSNETAYVNAGPLGTTDLTWKTIQINKKKSKDFKEITSVKPRATAVIKVTGFELNGVATQVSFSVHNISSRFNSHALIDVACGTIIK